MLKPRKAVGLEIGGLPAQGFLSAKGGSESLAGLRVSEPQLADRGD